MQRILIGSMVVAGLGLGLTRDGQTEVAFMGDMDGPVQSSLLHVPFALLGAPTGGPRAPAPAARPASLAGSTIAAVDDGSLLIDEDSGDLVRIATSGKVVARVPVRPDAAQLVVDRARQRAYVSDRRGDRVVVYDVGQGLRKVIDFCTRAEPFGLALTPDGGTLLVTSVADRGVTAYVAMTGRQLWTADIGPEPRGVAISPSGKSAVVTMLGSGLVARIDLAAPEPQRAVRFVSLNPTSRAAGPNTSLGFAQGAIFSGRHHQRAIALSPERAAANGSAGRGLARSAFAATFIGHDIAVVPHQISTPRQSEGRTEVASSYGGGGVFNPPVAHRLAFLAAGDSSSERGRVSAAHVALHQPRAMAYDSQTDTLYVAGFGSDEVMALGAVSQAAVTLRWTQSVADGRGCGPSGVALRDDGQVIVYCSLQRRVAALSEPSSAGENKVAFTPEVTKTRFSPAAARGRALFRQGKNPQLSALGAMACSSCHPEGRADGLSWRIQGASLQTPILAGRTVGSHPFKWDGGDKTLSDSLRNTVTRLGGSGMSEDQAKDISAFLASLEPPRAPTPSDTGAVARGKALFESDAAGCASCHSGNLMTNGKPYDLAVDLERVDTPSLIGLASSAPYYHDGSAGTLRALLLENGSVHGMGQTEALDAEQQSDLIAYLMTL
jgi:DNA-binding beta-propeller fold protein YncE/mono/diheme cytochrome c family protein